MGPRVLENHILSQNVAIRVKLKSGMRGHIRHSEECNECCQKCSSEQDRIPQDITSSWDGRHGGKVTDTPGVGENWEFMEILLR